MSRGFENNNPANIRLTNIKWEGMSSEQNDKSFIQFTDMIYGLRALAIVLFNYNKMYNLKSIKEIINRFAPNCENPTHNYVKFVAGKVGIDENDLFNFANKKELIKLINAIIEFENGEPLNDDALVDKAISLAMKSLRKV